VRNPQTQKGKKPLGWPVRGDGIEKKGRPRKNGSGRSPPSCTSPKKGPGLKHVQAEKRGGDGAGAKSAESERPHPASKVEERGSTKSHDLERMKKLC